MLKYFFDTFDGFTLNSDLDGRFLPDVDAARNEAIEDAKEIIADGLYRNINLDHGEIRVRHSLSTDPDFVISFGKVFSGLRS